VWPAFDGTLSFLLTLVVQDRKQVLANEPTLKALGAFLESSPERYGWRGQRFVLMPEHLHLIAQPGSNAITLGSWVKALKAYLRRRTNQKEVWSWQAGYHDHKFRSAAEKARKWE